MSLLRPFAANPWCRLLAGGLFSGLAAAHFLPDQHSGFLLALSLAVIIGALCSLVGERIVEAIVKAIIIGSLLALSYPVVNKQLARGRELHWLIMAAIGFQWSLIIGSLLGGICREITDSKPSQASNETKSPREADHP